MDFLEGFLLGPYWSDTEYESRRHIGFYSWIGLIMVGLLGFVLFRPSLQSWILPWQVAALLLAVLILANPYLCRNYYRRPLILRFLILLAQIAKQVLAMLLLFAIALPFLSLDTSSLAPAALELTNESIANMTDRFKSFGNGLAMILGLFLGTLLIVFEGLAAIAAAACVPGIILTLLRWVQRLVDWIIRRKIWREIET
ncbi:MAG: hypothetical protein PHC86_00505 [Eubacteriales bacterium]|nr:hypothetical protein [Eubacteriales bacterium]